MWRLHRVRRRHAATVLRAAGVRGAWQDHDGRRRLSGRAAEAVKAAWTALDVPQCGYCQSGQVMSAVALLSEVRKPSDTDIDLAMNGNVCRCATYQRIRAAIHDAARRMEA
jgi:isoquinoline 1-oxidoreductase subunit alpha